MKTLQFNDAGELIIQPSATSSPNDFDFYVGKWNVRNKKLKTRMNNNDEWLEFDATAQMHKTLNGTANHERIFANFDGQPFEGMAVRLFNPQTKLWTIYWADSKSCVMDTPVVGSFEGPIGEFFAKDKFNGKDIIMLYRWDATDTENLIWSQAFSPDNGQTWEWNWYMYFSKAS